MVNYLKFNYKNPILQKLISVYNIHRPGAKKNVFIFSMPRSGSTWLMELIWSQPGFKYCNEPLNIKDVSMQKKTGIAGYKDLYSDGVKSRLIAYFKGIAEGKIHFLDPKPFRKYFRIFTNRIVFKVIHGGEKFINEIADSCNGNVIYLLRHPIPVALSRRELPRMNELCSDFVLKHFSEEERRLALELNKSGDEMERRMLAWCIQNKFALMQRRDDWVVITYEQLTVDPNPVIAKIATAFDLPLPDKILEHISIPSAVSVQSERSAVDLMKEAGKNREELIGKWRKKIAKEEEIRLMNICLQFNMHIYSAGSVLPKKEWLI